MSTVSAYAATSATEPLTKTTINRRDPGPHDVAIDIKFAGICHSDIHTVKAEWGVPNYPVVPGHEIAGGLSAVDAAAPLLCAGITLYSPLRHWNTEANTRLAIIGLGGLGHMGVKLGAAMGAEVTVLSQSLKKMEDGLRLGASNYYATADPDTFRKLRSSFDLILNTVSANLNLNDYVNLLDVDGTLVELGIPEHPMEVGAFPLALARRSLSGSNIGGIAETQEMLNFCAEHDVTPEIELIKPDYVNEAYERVLASDVRYRFVIDISKL